MNRFYTVILRNLHNVVFRLPRMMWMARHPERYSEQRKYKMCMSVVRMVTRGGGIRVEAYGLENIPEGPCLVCPNHQDKYDPLAVWETYPTPINVVIDDAACHRPVIREFTTLLNSIKLEKRSLKSMYKMAGELSQRMSAGEKFILFPEGQYEEDYSTLLPFMAGCFRSALEAEVPVLPVAIINSFHIFAENRKKPVVQIHYLPPVMPDDFKGMKTRTLSDLVRDRIQETVDLFQNNVSTAALQ